MPHFDGTDIDNVGIMALGDGGKLARISEINLFLKLFAEASGSDFLPGLIHADVGRGKFSLGVEQLLLHGDQDLDWESEDPSIDYESVFNSVIEFCKSDGGTFRNCTEVGNDVTDTSIEITNSSEEVDCRQMSLYLPFGITTLFMNLTTGTTTYTH